MKLPLINSILVSSHAMCNTQEYVCRSGFRVWSILLPIWKSHVESRCMHRHHEGVW